MVKLTDEIKEEFAKMKIFPFATASKEGVPNVIPIGMCYLQEDAETIWIVDNYFHKTMENLRANPKGAIYVWGAEIKGCFQIKGDIKIVDRGEDYEEMRKIVKAKSDHFPAKFLVKMKITDVFECKGGPDAGKKLL
ncbi:pyridoxamine 5'-phosphate oxidase family protein [Methanolobus psychrotolerans]|uniref:pyridoxamine 5'-phosphate oxidase family protein n=1 Tax=Methanolobus psychrotolerans TaxID=1874706 RepID=UPI000B9177FB|nr:pyridoxamine 5'-phosphate oxidase family protein [Methanolobus psychrotolerans]